MNAEHNKAFLKLNELFLLTGAERGAKVRVQETMMRAEIGGGVFLFGAALDVDFLAREFESLSTSAPYSRPQTGKVEQIC